jgi:hypothetical protein
MPSADRPVVTPSTLSGSLEQHVDLGRLRRRNLNRDTPNLAHSRNELFHCLRGVPVSVNRIRQPQTRLQQDETRIAFSDT